MKHRITAAGLIALMAALLWNAEAAAEAVRSGLTLCFRSVIPALFPFFVAVSLFTALGLAEGAGRRLAPLLRPVLGCSGTGATAFLLGLAGGYPIGGRTVGELYASGVIDRAEAEHLLSFCNNCGGAFVLGVAGMGCFGSIRAGAWLYAIHVLAAVLTAQLRRRSSAAPVPAIHREPVPFAAALVRSVSGGAQAMLSVCAFVVFSRVVLHLIVVPLGIIHPLAIGFIELTGGILQLTPDRAGFVMAAALLGWGGISVHCQTAAVLGKTDLSLRPYFTGKALQAVLSAVMAFPAAGWAIR
ncbi:MAG: sporulation protein [Oscillospiraceae bacterium]|nr:sporulation protein [Oscillospiraceae bacterium]